ncbi:hypothetical protein MPTK1_5g07968 [Marchantia polymorpha subsp. ruderalis]
MRHGLDYVLRWSTCWIVAFLILILQRGRLSSLSGNSRRRPEPGSSASGEGASTLRTRMVSRAEPVDTCDRRVVFPQTRGHGPKVGDSAHVQPTIKSKRLRNVNSSGATSIGY